jgi:hypothetical protein
VQLHQLLFEAPESWSNVVHAWRSSCH